MGQAMELALKQQAYVCGDGTAIARPFQPDYAATQSVSRNHSRNGWQQVEALIKVSRSVLGQAAALGKLQEGEANLLQLQAMLNQNLATLAAAGFRGSRTQINGRSIC
jgi:hypothetical protein